MTRLHLRAAALSVLLLASAPATAQVTDPCFPEDTTAWEPGPGWQKVGDCRLREPNVIRFDAAGTLYGVDSDVDTLDTTGGWPGVWRQIDTPVILGFLPLSTADSLVGGTGTISRRTVDRHATWPRTDDAWMGTLFAAPPGAARAGRLFSSGINGPLQLSDDRGASWHPPDAYPPGYDLQQTSIASFPTTAGPWGTGYSGRVLAAGFDQGVSLSDDGGDTWYRSGLWMPGYYHAAAVLARSPSEGGGLRAVVLSEGPSTPSGCVSVWTSDDGGQSWTARSPMCEDCVGLSCAAPAGLLPLARRQTGGAPVSGAAADWPETEWETTEAVAVLRRGGVFCTTDGGATWVREPGPAGQIPFERPSLDLVLSSALGPDGRFYAGVARIGSEAAWALRSSEPFTVSSPRILPPAASSLDVSVRPNPSRGRIAVAVDLAAPSSSVRVVVLDAVGREVAQLHDGPAANTLSLSLDTSRLAPGIYTVRATSSTETATTRLTVAR